MMAFKAVLHYFDESWNGFMACEIVEPRNPGEITPPLIANFLVCFTQFKKKILLLKKFTKHDENYKM